MVEFNIKNIEEAHNRIESYIIKTPLISNESINKKVGANVFFKLENLQITGSFKIRGASNKIIKLNKEERKNGIIAYSSGNHAQAVAYVASLFSINSTIVMPKDAPKIKIQNTKKFGSNILLYDPLLESREKIASEISLREKKIVIKPYDDLDVIAGQGTVGKEITEELLKKNIKPDIYLCCCGGGGLISGSSTYIKHFFPDIKIFSVEPENLNDTQLSLQHNKIISNKKSATSICDALLAPQPGSLTFDINNKILDAGLSVSDKQVKKTIITLSENLKILVEPGGAVAAAALLSNKIKLKNRNIIVMISGGNIDRSLFSSIVEGVV